MQATSAWSCWKHKVIFLWLRACILKELFSHKNDLSKSLTSKKLPKSKICNSFSKVLYIWKGINQYHHCQNLSQIQNFFNFVLSQNLLKEIGYLQQNKFSEHQKLLISHHSARYLSCNIFKCLP